MADKKEGGTPTDKKTTSKPPLEEKYSKSYRFSKRTLDALRFIRTARPLNETVTIELMIWEYAKSLGMKADE